MRTITFCIVVITVASVANAVENVYGWTHVRPVAAQAWQSGKGWVHQLVGPDSEPANAESLADGKAHPFGQAVTGTKN